MGIGEVAEPKAKLKKKVEIMDESLIEKQNGNFANGEAKKRSLVITFQNR